MARKLNVGVVGCGNISLTYFKFAPLFRSIEIAACADLNHGLAEQRAGEFGVTAMTPQALLAAPEIDIVLNLTVPAAHFAVSLAAVTAGKHVYSEKPLTLSLKDGLALKAATEKHKVKLACAPDTILGGAHQLARKAVDDGVIGKVTGGTAVIMGHGMEHWHPNPDFFFKPGGGPVLDMGPYYIGALINLIGPVTRVAALSSAATPFRTISSAPRAGQKIKVETPTNIHALLEFASGATVTLLASWDVWAHRHPLLELYGTEGSLFVPDPNFFGGDVLTTRRGGAAEALPGWDHPLGIGNHPDGKGPMLANYRAAGLADLADAILKRRDPRCSIDRALHAVEVMTGILASGADGKFKRMKTSCTRPKPLPPDAARALMG
ncbi:MAG: Gfo/Idh/MocA family oxidoreductase [Aestuariivirga sp.]|nr:Gfo/Idh/MocA family oxidoreductase [Aestuariivirga sp.]